MTPPVATSSTDIAVKKLGIDIAGFLSRIDFGSPGYRVWLLKLAAKCFLNESVEFVCIVGGLVSQKYLKLLLPKKKEEQLGQIHTFAEELSKDLPVFKNKAGKELKIYLVTSPAYDGWIGQEVAKQLVTLRKDIRYLDHGVARIPLKNSDPGAMLGLLTPIKAAWRSKFYSTLVDRLIEDEEKRSTQGIPKLWVVGCTCTSLFRCKGEMKTTRISVPGLHKLEDISASENQVGIRVVRFFPNDEIKAKTISFKDLTANERKFIKAPQNCTKIQLQVIESLKNNGPSTLGALEEGLKLDRDKITTAIAALEKRTRTNACIYLNEESQRYDFKPDYLQRKVEYDWPTEGWVEDAFLAWGCLHSGSNHTAYKWFNDFVPWIILREKIKICINAGDTIEGLKHDLAIIGEVVGGMNYTGQELLSAYMHISIWIQVFKKQFEEAEKANSKKFSETEVETVIDNLLMTLMAILGNHDEWSRVLGFDSLALFEAKLESIMTKTLEKFLSARGYAVAKLPQLVAKKIHMKNDYTFPSGLTLRATHYHAGRSSVSSHWCQKALNTSQNNIEVIANFHVAECVEQWDKAVGQRVAMQVPTIKSKSDYESKKGKKTDFGVGLARTWSLKGRIIVSEVTFLGDNPNESLDNKWILRKLCEDVGITKHVDIE